jgi:hypothetical protein
MNTRQVLRALARAKPIAVAKPPRNDSGRTLKKRALNKVSLDATIKSIEDENRAIERGEVWELDPKKRRHTPCVFDVLT